MICRKENDICHERSKCHSSKANEITTKIEHLFLPVENFQTAGKNHYVLFLERVGPSIANYQAVENNLPFYITLHDTSYVSFFGQSFFKPTLIKIIKEIHNNSSE